MCYDIKTTLKTQLKYAKRYTPELVTEIEEQLKPWQEKLEFNWHHASGFSHPHLLIYTNESNWRPEVAQWGLIPHWTKDLESAKTFWNNTLNARSETIFEKPSFRDAAKSKRCLIVIDGFFEHHHFNGKTYPYYFEQKNKEPLTLAGLWSEWTDQATGEVLKTFTIVTTYGNELFAKIHNNPKLAEPRMPVILEEDMAEHWLNVNLPNEKLKHLFAPKDHLNITHHTVRRLRGKEYIGNTEEVTAPIVYEELEAEQGSLF